MKKVLFVLGLALCSTFAMAQTNRGAIKNCSPMPAPQKLEINADKPVDYKSSIFTKDDEGVVLGYVNFDGSQTLGIGTVAATDMIDDTVVGAINCHNRTEPCFKWARIQDSAYTHSTQFAADYNYYTQYISVTALNRYMGVRNGINDDNGFMFISLTELNEDNNALNTYFTIPAVAITGNPAVVDVTWRQLYRKYYDNCYLDYKLGGNWYSFEVNVTGIDVEVTDVASGYYVATLPPAAINQANLELRFRVTADGTLPYGYGWAIDEVKVVAVTATERWSFNRQGYINGFYGTLPQGFQIPVSYVVFTRNTATTNLTNPTLTINHRTGNQGTFAPVMSTEASRNPSAIVAGDPNQHNLLQFDESGFMYANHGWDDYRGYHAFPEYYSKYDVTDAQLAAAGYQRRALPTATVGKNQFAIVASNGQNMSDTLDMMTYTVSDNFDAKPAFGRTIAGYRWANDNGIVPAGREFAYGFTSAGPNQAAGFVTSNCGHQYEEQYEVLTRYNTPSVIPTDANGEPWVIRGIEYVTSTKLTSAAVAGATIVPEIYRYVLPEDGSDSGWYGYIRYTGLAGDQVCQITSSSAPESDEDLTLYTSLDNDNYYAYNVLFPDQPALEPNVSFLLGYQNNGGGDFAVASTSYSYKLDDSTSMYYSGDPDIADYYNQYTATDKVYDVYCTDPIQGSRGNGSHVVTGWNIDNYPMIRLIVGPKMGIPTHDVYFDCENNEDDFWVYYNGQSMCNSADPATEGSSRTYYFIPGTEAEMDMTTEDGEYYIIDTNSDDIPSKIVDAIYLDGQAINLNDEDMVTKIEYNFYWPGHTPADADPWEPALERYYYAVTLRNILTEHTLTATCHSEDLSIRNVEDNINMTLAPNPATSQVRLNIAGFNGKANCSILDMSGRVVYTTDITAGESVLNLNGVPAGAYFVRVTNAAFSKVEKLIVR